MCMYVYVSGYGNLDVMKYMVEEHKLPVNLLDNVCTVCLYVYVCICMYVL